MNVVPSPTTLCTSAAVVLGNKMWWRGKCARFIFSLKACRESFWTGSETGHLLAVLGLKQAHSLPVIVTFSGSAPKRRRTPLQTPDSPIVDPSWSLN